MESFDTSRDSQPANPGARIAWQAQEYENRPKSRRWFLVLSIILIIIISYAIYTQSPLMAITFILIGIVGYLSSTQQSPILQFSIDIEGVHAGKEMYPYENIISFWIFYQPGERKYISLHTNGELTPYVHIPLANMDPLQIRSVLLQFIPEKRHPIRLVDVLEKYLS